MKGQDKKDNRESYSFFAFISYNKKDTKWGKRLQRKLEHYHLPAALRKETGWEREPINPVFFAPTDIQPGVLPDELKAKLLESQYLVIICSPNSANSFWVGQEIDYFCKLGRLDRIYCFIIDGDPESEEEGTRCYHPILKKNIPGVFGANVHEKNYRLPWLNRERAYIQLISKLLGLHFDELWKRNKRHIIRNVIMWCLGFIGVLVSMWLIWITNRPFDLTIELSESSYINPDLPPLKDAVITLNLGDEIRKDTIKTMDSRAVIRNIPHHYLGEKAGLHLSCRDYLDTDTTVIIEPELSINVRRNPSVYGDVSFRLWDLEHEQYLKGINVSVEGRMLVSDRDGRIRIHIPLEGQKRVYSVSSPFHLQKDSIVMPCSENEVLFVGRN